MTVNGTKVTINGIADMGENEVSRYLELIRQQTDEEIIELSISQTENGKIDLDYSSRPPKFERIRRITGYLVGTIDRWNNAKRAEEHDRVKHGLAKTA